MVSLFFLFLVCVSIDVYKTQTFGFKCSLKYFSERIREKSRFFSPFLTYFKNSLLSMRTPTKKIIYLHAKTFTRFHFIISRAINVSVKDIYTCLFYDQRLLSHANCLSITSCSFHYYGKMILTLNKQLQRMEGEDPFHVDGLLFSPYMSFGCFYIKPRIEENTIPSEPLVSS